MLLQFLPKNIYPYRSTVKVSPSRQSLQRLFEHQSSCWQFWELRYVLWLITDRSSGVQKVAVITDATTSSLSIYTQPQLLHPASAYTPRLFTASTPSLSFYIQPQPIHPDPSQPLHPASASTSGLSLYTQPQPPHPDSASTPSLRQATHSHDALKCCFVPFNFTYSPWYIFFCDLVAARILFYAPV